MEKPLNLDTNKILSDQYYNYINSKEWAAKRTQRLNLDNYKCQKCGETRNLEVHHLNYIRFGNENINTDLITLCRECHRQIELQKGETLQEKQERQDALRKEYEERLERVKEEQLQIAKREKTVNQFILMADAQKYDYSDNGPYNLCDYKQIRILVNDYAGTNNEDYWTGVIRDYFYGKRCEKIKALRMEGMTDKEIAKKYRFSTKQLCLSDAEIELYIKLSKQIKEDIQNEQTSII